MQDQHKNVQDLRSLSQTNDGLVPLNDQVFSRLVLEKNRPYGIYVLFNARDKRFNCDVCGPFEDELRLVAQSYKKMKEKDDIPLLFFGVAEWGPNQRSFNQVRLSLWRRTVDIDKDSSIHTTFIVIVVVCSIISNRSRSLSILGLLEKLHTNLTNSLRSR